MDFDRRSAPRYLAAACVVLVGAVLIYALHTAGIRGFGSTDAAGKQFTTAVVLVSLGVAALFFLFAIISRFSGGSDDGRPGSVWQAIVSLLGFVSSIITIVSFLKENGILQ